MDQIIRAAPGPIVARVTIPGSKSMTNRALLLAALANGVSKLSEILISDDTLTFINALHTLGISIQLDKSARTCRVEGASGQFPNAEASIWCADSGITARFLLAACSGSLGAYHFDGSEQLRARPIASLLQVLPLLSAKTVPTRASQLPVTVMGQGVIQGGEIKIDAAETGQFISALLMIAPFASTPCSIQAKTLVSYPYIEMTCTMMAEFGVLVQRPHPAHFIVPVPQCYKACNYVIEPDFSTAAYFFAAAAVTGGQVTMQSINSQKSKQGDIVFLQVLEKMGCNIIASDNGLTVKGPVDLWGVNVDMRDFSDLFMTLAALAPFAKSPTTITRIGHVRHKESDRLTVMFTELKKLQAKVERGTDWLKIYPSILRGAVIDSHYDHRIAMAFAIVGLRVPGIIIRGAECVSKTCPEFFSLWNFF